MDFLLSVEENTLDFLELVRKRRSIRQFAPKPIPRKTIDSCLEAARWAPSACNSQPWSFVVVDDPEVMNRIAQKALSGIYKMNAFVRDAPVLIVVLTERSKYIARLGGQLRQVKYSLIDIGIACEHLILRATELGLGTCWLGWFNERAIKKILGLRESQKVDVMIVMGYPKKVPGKKKKRKSVEKLRKYYSVKGGRSNL